MLTKDGQSSRVKVSGEDVECEICSLRNKCVMLRERREAATVILDR